MATSSPDNEEDQLFEEKSREIHQKLKNPVYLFNNYAKNKDNRQNFLSSWKDELEPSTDGQPNTFEKNRNPADAESEPIQISNDTFTENEMPASDLQSNTIGSANNTLAEDKYLFKIFEDAEVYKKYEDTTHFAVAEIGFFVKVKDHDDIKCYNYPVKLGKKNIFNIHDILSLEEEKFNGKNIFHNIFQVKKADGFDYHSESALYLLYLRPSFQEEMIRKLADDLNKDKFELTELKRLTVQIRGIKDTCKHCYKKAKYLTDWVNKNEENYFEDFKEKLRILNENIVFAKELKLFIYYSSEEGKKLDLKELDLEENKCFIWLEKIEDPSESDRKLSDYSIITSGGEDKKKYYYRYYNYAYDQVAM